MKLYDNANTSVWHISVSNAPDLENEPPKYTVFCSARFTQPHDAVTFAKKHVMAERKAGSKCRWTGILHKGRFCNQWYYEPPADIEETKDLIIEKQMATTPIKLDPAQSLATPIKLDLAQSLAIRMQKGEL